MIADRNSSNSHLMYCSSTGPTVEDMHVMPYQVGIERQISRRLSRPAGYILHDFEQETAADMPIGLTSRAVLQKPLSSSGKGLMLQSEKAAGTADSKRLETITEGRRSSCYSSNYDPISMKKSPRTTSFDSGEARKSPRTTNTDAGDVKRDLGKSDSMDVKRSSGSGGVEGCSAPRILPRSGLSDSDAALNQAASTCGVQESKKTCITETPRAGDGQVPGTAGEAEEEPVSCRVACQSWAGQKNGIKKANQDAYCFMRSVDRRFLVFGVFDGHGTNGHHVARFVKENLPQCLMKQPTVLVNPGLAFTEAFAAVDRSLESSVECSVSGTTAVMAQIQERTLTLAWAGDSRAVIGRTGDDGTMEVLPLSIDHKPDVKAEKQRIVENNGRVDRLVDQFGDEVGPYRVWLRNAPILGLAMSRSLGDVLAHTVGVSSEPEICTYNLTPQDRFLILASDGVWEFISSEEAVKIVSGSPTPESGCKKLMMTARSRWLGLDHGCYVDDITAMVIGFTHH